MIVYHSAGMNALPSRLEINTAEDRSLKVEGVIDCHTAADLERHLRDLGTASDVSIDLSAIDFIDSSGLRVLVDAHQQLDADERRLVLGQPSDAVTRVLEITGLRDHLHLA